MEDFKKLGRPDAFPARTQVLIEGGRASALAPYLHGGEPLGEPEGLLVEYYRLLIRHRWIISAFALMGATLAFLFCLTTRPVYRARTSLDIQNLNADFINMREITPTSMPGPATPEVFIQTEIKLLQSDTLLNRTKQRMEEEAHSLRVNDAGFVSKARTLFHLPGYRPPAPQETVEYTAKSLAVKPLGLTHLVEITCDSWNAKFAADFCNALSAEFQQEDREVRWSEAQKTSEWLSRQLADVRDQLATSEKRLERASEANGLVFSQQNGGSVGEEKLRELQAELMKAQADRVTRQAQFEISKSATTDSLPVVLDDTQLRDYQTRLVELNRQLAELMPPLTDAHPKIQHIKSQIRELEASLAAKKANVIERMQNEFQASRHREDLLSSAYLTQERKVAVEMGRETQANMLRRDVDSGQQLYQTLSQRVKEAGLASAMQASTIRTVDPALVPPVPILPRKIQTIMVGILLGTVAGVCFAFFKDRTETVLRAPGEAPRFLNVRELGVIPSARVGLDHAYARRLPQNSSPGTALMLKDASQSGALARNEAIDLATWKANASLVAEAYRSATYSILLESRGAGRGRAYVVTSPSAGEGKTSVSCNLGIALAQANRRVLVIDGDLRRPRLHKSMAIPNDCGLRDVLRGDIEVAGGTLHQFCRASQVPNMFILPSGTGTEEPSGLLYSPQLQPLLRKLVEEFDVVLIDSPPVLHLADARIIAGSTDGVILVLRARSTDREAARNASNLFQHDQVRIVGTILNDFDPLSHGNSGYYDSYYKYAQANSNGNEELGRA